MSVFSVQLAGRVGPAAIGQFQQPSMCRLLVPQALDNAGEALLASRLYI